MKKEITITKKCSTCKEQKPLNEFAKDYGSFYDRYYQCKTCTAIASKYYRKRKKEGTIIAF
jgi:hypothetical protein